MTQQYIFMTWEREGGFDYRCIAFSIVPSQAQVDLCIFVLLVTSFEFSRIRT